MATTQAQDLYRAGQLQDAIAAATAEVRSHPNDPGARGLLAELFCFTGEIERADRQFGTLADLDTSLAVGISMIRQILRAEQARQQFYTEGRVPEFLDQPSDWLKLHLRASIHLRDKQPEEAMALLTEAEAARPRVSGTCDGKPFDDLRDIDDLTSCFFEVLTSNGKYYWIPMERVESIEFHPPRRPRDLIWREARMIVRDGPDGEVYLPALYAGSAAESDDRLRLGRMTDWRDAPNAPVRGIGQRMFLVGSEDRPIMEIQQLTFQR